MMGNLGNLGTSGKKKSEARDKSSGALHFLEAAMTARETELDELLYRTLPHLRTLMLFGGSTKELEKLVLDIENALIASVMEE